MDYLICENQGKLWNHQLSAPLTRRNNSHCQDMAFPRVVWILNHSHFVQDFQTSLPILWLTKSVSHQTLSTLQNQRSKYCLYPTNGQILYKILSHSLHAYNYSKLAKCIFTLVVNAKYKLT